MKVDVRLFAALRERAGSATVAVELADGAAVGDVWPLLALGDEPPGLLYAVNRAYADRAEELAEGDEVAVIPPVSGGDFRLSDEALSVDAAVAEVRDDGAGAIATFVGTTRAHSHGRDVLHLDYEAYEGMAEQVMADLGRRALAPARPVQGGHSSPRRARRYRRDERRDRRFRSSSRRRPRRLQGGDRRVEGVRPAVEERDLRGW